MDMHITINENHPATENISKPELIHMIIACSNTVLHFVLSFFRLLLVVQVFFH